MPSRQHTSPRPPALVGCWYKLEDVFDIETVRRNLSGIESAGPLIGRALTLEIAVCATHIWNCLFFSILFGVDGASHAGVVFAHFADDVE